ncbi:MAG: hypothetical protein CTY16_07150 [Methylobacter sp.]|nr:MAG: hypothetical protein CTY16_07150 [Methylobacter sp.]
MKLAQESLKAAQSERIKGLEGSSFLQIARNQLKEAASAQESLKAAQSERIKSLEGSSFLQIARNQLKEAASAQESLKAAQSERIKGLEGSSFLQIARHHLKEAASAQESLKAAQSERIKDFEAILGSFNLCPNTSLASLLNTIHYAASSSEAINKDWQNVGNDLWQSWAAIKDEHE